MNIKKIISMLMLLMFSMTSIAQEAAATAEFDANSMTLKEVIETGGVLMYVLAVMSFIGLAFVLYFFLTLRRTSVVPESFLEDIQAVLGDGREEEALNLCKNNKSPLAAIAYSAIDYKLHSDSTDLVIMKEIMEGEGSRQASSVQGQIQYLLDIAVISPMVGLLGTVIGMLNTFNVVALDIAKAKPVLLAAGVSQALVTTAAGLVVGIPAMVFYAYFRGRSTSLLSDMEVASSKILTYLGVEDKSE